MRGGSGHKHGGNCGSESATAFDRARGGRERRPDSPRARRPRRGHRHGTFRDRRPEDGRHRGLHERRRPCLPGRDRSDRGRGGARRRQPPDPGDRPRRRVSAPPRRRIPGLEPAARPVAGRRAEQQLLDPRQLRRRHRGDDGPAADQRSRRAAGPREPRGRARRQGRLDLRVRCRAAPGRALARRQRLRPAPRPDRRSDRRCDPARRDRLGILGRRIRRRSPQLLARRRRRRHRDDRRPARRRWRRPAAGGSEAAGGQRIGRDAG